MNINELIQARRTVHQFNDQKVSQETIDRAFELALWAPNHRLTYPWRFVDLGQEARSAIGQLSADLKRSKQGLSDIEAKALAMGFLRPSHLVAVVQVKNADAAIAKEDYASIAMAVQNIHLYLWSEGIGLKWTTGAVTRNEQTYRIAQVNPESEEIVGFLWVGYFDKVPPTPRRPKFSDIWRSVP